MRRLALIWLDAELLKDLLVSGERAFIVKSPLPKSAAFKYAFYDYSRQAFGAVFEDDSFNVVQCGSEIPAMGEPKITPTLSVVQGIVDELTVDRNMQSLSGNSTQPFDTAIETLSDLIEVYAPDDQWGDDKDDGDGE